MTSISPGDSIQIIEVQSQRELQQFIQLPYELYRKDPLWVPPLKVMMKDLLSKKKNPFFEHATSAYFIAQQNGKVVGRIAAIHNRGYNEYQNDQTGFFGFFETIDDLKVSTALLKTTEAWIKKRNLSSLRGPTSFSTNEECGLVVGGTETPPTVLCPHNLPYYESHLLNAGFKKVKDLLNYQKDATSPPERFERLKSLLERRHGIKTRPLNMRTFWQDVQRLKDLYKDAWEKNWGFVPMTEAELNKLAKDLKPFLHPNLALFAEKEGTPIGVAIALPDVNVALQSNRKGSLLPGLWSLFKHKNKIDRLRIILLGVLKEYRRTGADALLCSEIWNNALQLGYTWGEAGWILEDNHMMNNALKRMGFEAYKTLRLYEKEIISSPKRERGTGL